MGKSVTVCFRTLSVPATLEPTPSSQCPSPIESIRLERARQMRLDADNDDQEPDTPLLSTAEDDEAEDETQFNSTSFWTYVDHILCAVHADAKAKANTTEEYEDILNKFFHTAFQDDLTQFPMKKKVQAANEVTTKWQADIAENLVWL
ncbi:hypothetical protein EW026_g7185 [Hermanssonia centrifuga]|uniref:Uncharacterized protein n=1 Tax=Hermanssonia centrifuga TaxID=98765 RepID=A0A4S4K8L7_9APHY|nr:hypothetical protein EW026_g7185 [Hermanssonia centrifuga]